MTPRERLAVLATRDPARVVFGCVKTYLETQDLAVARYGFALLVGTESVTDIEAHCAMLQLAIVFANSGLSIPRERVRALLRQLSADLAAQHLVVN